MSVRRRTALRGILLLISVLFFIWWMVSGRQGGGPMLHPDVARMVDATKGLTVGHPDACPSEKSVRPSLPGGLQAPLTPDMIKQMRGLYADTIVRKRVQVAFIEDIVSFLKQAFPESWEGHVPGVLEAVFPECAQELYDLFARLEGYNSWLRENRGSLLRMASSERRDILWDKRREVFGGAADEIWEAELKNERIAGVLEELESFPDMPMPERLAEYEQAIHDACGDDADRFITGHRQELVNGFLNMQAVQNDLKNMSPEKRGRSLRAIRKGLQMDEPALTRWEELDRVRDERWEKGNAYMEQRRKLMETIPEEGRQAALHSLRTRFFGSEAEVIGREEASGFFRFGQERVYGRN